MAMQARKPKVKNPSKTLSRSSVAFKPEPPKIGDRVAAIDARTSQILYVGRLTTIGIATTHFAHGGRLVPRTETFLPNKQVVKVVKIGKLQASA